MATAALAIALHLAAGPLQLAQAAPPSPAGATAAPKPPAELEPEPEPTPEPARAEFDAAFLLALGQPTTPGLALRGRVRLFAGLWLHAGASARGGSAPADGGVREIPFELGLGYRLPLGQYFSLGVRGEAVLLSRRMVVANAEPQHRWLAALRGGVEARVHLNEQLGLTLLVGAEGRLGRTEVNVGATHEVFSPVAPYFELGPSIYF